MERNGLDALLHEWHRRFIGPVTDSRAVYAGFALFSAGVGLVVVSIATFLWSTTTDPAGTFKFVLREFAVLTGATGIPTILLGVTVLLPVSRRIDAVAAAGVAGCLVAAARFTQVYPDAWYPNASAVVGLYAVGAVVVVATAGTALSGYHAEQTGRRIARERLDQRGDGDGGDTGGSSGSDAVTDEQVQADIDESARPTTPSSRRPTRTRSKPPNPAARASMPRSKASGDSAARERRQRVARPGPTSRRTPWRSSRRPANSPKSPRTTPKLSSIGSSRCSGSGERCANRSH
jgi:hypothetical protein